MSWLFYAFLAALTYGTYYILLKRNINREFIWSYFAFFFTLLFALLIPFTSFVNFPQEKVVWGIILLHVALLAMFFFFSSIAYKHLEESEVSPLGNLGLIVMVLVGMFIFRETLTLLQLLGVALMIVGAFILEAGIHISRFKRVFKSAVHRKYIYCIFLAILFSVSSSILEKIILDPSVLDLSFAPLEPFSLNYITRGLLMCFFLSRAFFKKEFIPRLKHIYRHAGWLILLAAVVYNVANISYFTALSLGNFTEVIPIASLSTLFIVLVGGSLFHEHHLKQKVVASIIMIIATWLIVM